MFQVNGYNVMIVSPSDVIQECETCKNIIYEWNAIHSEKTGLYLNPIGWDINSYPEMGSHPQSVLNRQLLEKEVSISLHSRMLHKHARVIYDNPELFDKIKRAWAIWMLANSSYGHSFIAGFGYDRTGGTSKKLDNKRSDFSIDYAIRLQRVQIECYDAVRIIDSRDTPETFFYCDPPYVNSDQGHYDGYTQDDFDTLLKTLKRIKGKFLLSSFRNKSLDDFSKQNGWHTQELKMSSSMTNHYESTKRNKIEVLTANYPIHIDFL